MISAQPSPSAAPRGIPPAAWALAGASAALVALLAHHPVVAHGTGFAGTLAALDRLGAASALVHGTLFAVVGALLYGVTALALVLDVRRPAVAFGLICHAGGCAAIGGAMLFDGFVTAPLARDALAHGWTADAALPVLTLVGIVIQALTRAGFVAMGAGICCLSWADACATRALALLAVPGGLATALAAAGGLHMHPRTLMALTALQALWYAGAALALWRGRGAAGV